MKTFHLLVVCSSLIVLFNCKPNTETNSSVSSHSSTPADKTMPTKVVSDCKLVLGFDAWEPYQYIDVGERVTGLDIELAEEVLKEMNCAAEFKAGTWVSLMNDLKNGDVDLLLGASKTPAREEFALFSQPYRMEEYSLYIRKEDSQFTDIKSISAFIEQEKMIGVVEDYFYGPEVSMLRDGSATSKFFMTAIIGEVNVARLLDRDIDAFLEDSFVGASVLRRKALGDYIIPQGLTINTGDAHVMFSKKSVSPDELERFNLALAKIKSSPFYSDLLNRYKQ
jgi:polar amino acid transport system substrate-binding protein